MLVPGNDRGRKRCAGRRQFRKAAIQAAAVRTRAQAQRRPGSRCRMARSAKKCVVSSVFRRQTCIRGKIFHFLSGCLRRSGCRLSRRTRSWSPKARPMPALWHRRRQSSRPRRESQLRPRIAFPSEVTAELSSWPSRRPRPRRLRQTSALHSGPASKRQRQLRRPRVLGTWASAAWMFRRPPHPELSKVYLTTRLRTVREQLAPALPRIK